MVAPQDPEGEYGLLFAANPIPMWVFDTETLQFLEVNKAAVANYGYSRDEFLGMTIADIRPPEDVPALLADVRAPRETPLRGGPGLWRHRRKDGSLLTAEITAQEIAFQGRPARLVSAHDASERVHLAEKVESEHKFLQSVLDTMPAVVFVKDHESRFILVNTAWEEVTGVPRDQATGQRTADVFPADVADRMRSADLETFAAGDRTEAELTFLVDGRLRTYLSSRFPLRDGEGRAVALVGLALNITERKRAQEQEARLSRVVEQASDSIIITDLQGDITYVNPAFESISGYSRDEAIGQTPRLLKSGHQDAGFYRHMWDALVRGEVWTGRLVNRRKDGTLFQEDATVGPVRDSSGRTVSYLAVKRDVTNEMRLERQLMQAQKMEAIGRFAGGVAHDFNNLLSVITGYGELTRSKLAKADPLQGNLDQIVKAADRAAALIRQLLAFSRQQILQPTIVDLNALVSTLAKMLRRLIGEDVELVTSLGPQLGKVRGDPGQLEQVLMNLAVNARDAMPDGGRLTVETRNADLGPDDAAFRPAMRPGHYVMLAMTDTGMGMDAETQSHLFEPFFTTKEVGQGTGLGLSTVYGIVNQSEGYIGYESEVGVGTTFRIYLPRVDEVASRDPEPKATRPSPGSETVLLIEDDRSLRDLLCEILEGAGHTVLVAPDGAKALEIADEYAGAIQLIVTDVIMPGLSGRQAAEQIKASRSEVEILFISGYSDEAIAKHGVLAPKARFLSKPFTPGDLLRKVRDVLDGR
jgi:two-component system, cell cycle sensor histidine kinase and response regulator CckA